MFLATSVVKQTLYTLWINQTIEINVHETCVVSLLSFRYHIPFTKSVHKFEKPAQLSSARNFNFSTCIVFEIPRLDCFLFVAHNAETGNYSLPATIIRFALVAFRSISLLLVQRRFASGAFSFDRSALRLDDKQFTSAKK